MKVEVPEEWVEAAAEAMWNAMPHATRYKKLTDAAKHLARGMARAALAAVIPAIQAEALERAAVVADERFSANKADAVIVCHARPINGALLFNYQTRYDEDERIAAAIRALKEGT